MSGIRDFIDRDGYLRLSRALAGAAAADTTGELRVSGRPGGAFHFRAGLVVAVESPGAPGPEALLLRSGRVTGEQWAELMREPGAGKWPAAGLIAHGYAGAVQLRVVCMMAMQDAVFAILAGRVEECAPPADGHPLAPVPQGEPPARLLHEATRKLAALAALPHSVRPDGERPVPTAFAERAWPHLPHSQRELLTHADGRRTARDIAFRTGRSVYTVTAEISRMLQEGHLVCPGPEASPVVIRTEGDPGAALRRRRPPGASAPESRPGNEYGTSGARPGNEYGSPGSRTEGQDARAGALARSAPARPVPQSSTRPRPAPQPPVPVAQSAVTSASPRPAPQPPAPAVRVPATSAPASPATPQPPAPALPSAATSAPAAPTPRQALPRPALSPPVLSALAALPAEEGDRQQADTAGGTPGAGEQADGRRPGTAHAGAEETGHGAQARAAPAVAALPRRQPGASGLTKALDPGRNGTSWKGFFRLRSRGSGADA